MKLILSRPWLVALLLSFGMASAPATCAAQAISVADVVSFPVDPIYGFDTPAFNPAQGRNGWLYGVLGTGANATSDSGTVFDFSHLGVTNKLYIAPASAGYGVLYGLTLGTDGDFYGVVEGAGVIGLGAYGNLFRVTASGTFTVLHYFNGGSDGEAPIQTPIEASDGNIYGVTYGACCSASTVYKFTRGGVFSTVITFSGAQCTNAISVTEGEDGYLYVVCNYGGTTQNGTITRITKSGKLISTYSFPGGAGGSQPGGLVGASDGNYYGATLLGGNQNHGVIYRMTPQGTVTVVHTFNANNNGAYGAGFLIQATDGYLYGVASGGLYNNGALIRISSQGKYTEVYSFPTSIGGQQTYIMQATNGLIYGTAASGGTNGGGAIYSVNLHLAPFITFVLPVGKVGQSAQILGQGLTGTTKVTFNGRAATSFSVADDTYMTAVVPSGATTGKVVVTTPTGKLTSNVRFRILK